MIVNNKAGRFLHIGGEKLFPGVNKIADEKWAEIKKLHADRIGKDLLEVAATKDKETGELKGTDLAKVPANEAEKLIAETFSLPLLEEWKKADGRESVRMAIMNQIEFLKKPNTDEKKTND